ncbi:MAG: phosphodiester glycosidase family protein [Deltaproteobacteria bacterium]|nr:phosphodiester glycosidase family protein [Deltaproteobacteria bacterium]
MAKKKAADQSGKSRLRVWAGRLGKLSLVGLVAIIGLWIAIHRVPWLGPALADGVRAVVGPGPVAWAEDVAYGIQDRVNLWRYKDAKPKTFWEVPADVPAVPTTAAAADTEPPFLPPPFVPPYDDVATGADGIWVPVADPKHPQAPIGMFKSVVHPDKRRSFAALAVVAIDPRSFELHLVAGTHEPHSMKVKREERPGMIPAGHRDKLYAAFNGGFKATHGHYGMLLQGVEYLPPRDIACTFARLEDGSFRIATWSKLKEQAAPIHYYRQTPPCLVEDGDIHKVLNYNAAAKGWGATVAGETIIRRSAVGLDEDRKILFYGLGEAMTAQALARGMKAAGVHSAAELDVNYSYPRFLFYEHCQDKGEPVAVSALIPAIDFPEDQYVSRPSVRDFFYLTRASRSTARAAGDPSSKLAAKD